MKYAIATVILLSLVLAYLLMTTEWVRVIHTPCNWGPMTGGIL